MAGYGQVPRQRMCQLVQYASQKAARIQKGSRAYKQAASVGDCGRGRGGSSSRLRQGNASGLQGGPRTRCQSSGSIKKGVRFRIENKELAASCPLAVRGGPCIGGGGGAKAVPSLSVRLTVVGGA